MNLAELYAQANQRNALARRREPLDAPFDPLHQIPAGMTPPLRTGDVASMALQNAPGIGDVASLIDAYRAWQMGDKLQGGLSAVAALPFVGAIKAYHGSPHKFDKFDMSKIGTGEGAQTYGHGLYFAESPDVAGSYADVLGDSTLFHNGVPVELDQSTRSTALRSLAAQGYESSIKRAKEMLDEGADPTWMKNYIHDLDAMKNDEIGWRSSGNIYETSLEWPDPAREAADPLGPQHFLDWDRPLSEQPQHVQQRIKDYWKNANVYGTPDKLKGEGLWGSVVANWDEGGSGQAYAKGVAMRDLADAGIPGIRYLDAGSRGAGEGSSNFVVFDDQIPKITARNGQPLQRPDLTRQGIGAGPLRMATDDELRASLEAVHGRNAAKGLDADIATGAIRDEIARRNAVSMLGLPESNTAADRARAMEYVDPTGGDFYGGEHRPPMSDSGAPMHDLTGGGQVYPDDVYSYNAARYYGTGEPGDEALFAKLQALKGKPDASVRVYRAVPKDVMAAYGNNMHHGDWVTPSRQYAVEHGEGALNGDYKIQASNYPAKTLFTNGDSPYEFGIDKSQTFTDNPASIPLMIGKTHNANDRSRFAAFDPARRDSGNLLAQILGGVGLANLYAAMSGQQERQ